MSTAQDWGTASANTITKTQHHKPNATLDPAQVKLTSPFVVCIIGASRGIGAGVAYSYAKAGASGIVLVSRRTAGLEDTAAVCNKLNPGNRTEIVTCDITDASSVEHLAEKTWSKFGHLDVVVVNSGYSGPVVLKVTDTDPVTFQQAINVNYVGTFLCAKHFIPLLLKTDGGAKAFIAVNSLASLLIRGPIANTQYCVSKAAQLKLMEHIHEQYASEGLASISVHPGAVASEMAADPSVPESFRPFLIDSPELCGSFCVWLTKDKTRRWLSGRLLSANWDADELEARREEIVGRDMLKLK